MRKALEKVESVLRRPNVLLELLNRSVSMETPGRPSVQSCGFEAHLVLLAVVPSNKPPEKPPKQPPALALIKTPSEHGANPETGLTFTV